MNSAFVRNLITIFIVTGSIFPAFSQETFVGVRGGISIPNLSGGTNEVSKGYTSRLGPVFGALLEWGIKKDFALQFEVNYASQGGQKNGMQPITNPPSQLPPNPNGYYYANFKNEAILNYLEIPVMAKWSWTNFYVNAGPYIGFLLNAKTKTSGSSNIYADNQGTQQVTPQPVPFDSTTDVKSDIKSANFGISGGIGFKQPVYHGHVFIDARFEYGFNSIQKNTSVDGKSHTGGVFVTAGYAFKLAK